VVLAVLRVWLDDRPGSLAAVAGQIGAKGGDVVGIDVLERGAGRVIDEFVVELGDTSVLERVVAAVDDLDGVDVEFAEVVPEFPDPRLDALELASALVSATTGTHLLETLVEESQRRFGCTWAAVVDRARSLQVAERGPAPHASWLAAFVTGVSASGGEGPMDVAWATLTDTGLVLVLGRDQARFRERERRQINALAQIAAVRFVQTLHPPQGRGPEDGSGSTFAHPSWGGRHIALPEGT
jgi:ACT domain